MYAIWNKRTRKWLYGTDRRYHPWHQRTSEDRAMLFETRFEAEVELIPCPVCNQMPRIWTSKTTGGKCAKCDGCGYMVHDIYDINEHWYNCNMSRMWRINHGIATDVDHPYRKGKA